MSSYSDISGIENLRQASQSVRPDSFKTYVEGKAHEVQNDVADVVTGLGNELMGHASIKTLEHLGKAKKAVNKATKEFGERASKTLSDARDGVRQTIKDTIEPAQKLFSPADFTPDRTTNPFGGARIQVGEDGQARLAVSDTPLPEPNDANVLQPQEARGGDAPTPTARPAPAEPAPVAPEEPSVPTGGGGGGGADLSTDAMKGAEQVAKQGAEKEGEQLAEKGGEQVLKKGLKGAFLESLGEDETGIGIGATALLGIATLVAGVVSHHHQKPPPAITHYQTTQPINYNYQSGL